jgi:hypothetical protein
VKTLVCLLALAGITGCEERLEVGAGGAGRGVMSVLERGVGDGDTGWWPAVRFDAQDRPHIVWCDAATGNVRHATRQGAVWKIDAVTTEGGRGKYLALELDPQGSPAVTFYDQRNERLLFAREALGWKPETIVAGKELGVGGELRFDRAGAPHLFYYDPNGKVFHARRGADGTWRSDLVGTAPSGFSARAGALARGERFWVTFAGVAGSDVPAMLADIGPEAMVVKPLALQRAAGWRTWLGLDGAQPVLLTWVPASRSLELAELRADSWQSRRLTGDVANYAAAHDDAGDLAVAYQAIRLRDVHGGSLALLTRRGGAWQRWELPAEPPAGDYLAVGLTRAGKALVAWHAPGRRTLELYDETLPPGVSPTVLGLEPSPAAAAPERPGATPATATPARPGATPTPATPARPGATAAPANPAP